MNSPDFSEQDQQSLQEAPVEPGKRIPLIEYRGFLRNRSFWTYFWFGVGVQYAVGLSVPIVIISIGALLAGSFGGLGLPEVMTFVPVIGGTFAFGVMSAYQSWGAGTTVPTAAALLQVIMLSLLFSRYCCLRGCVPHDRFGKCVIGLYLLNWVAPFFAEIALMMLR